MPNKSLGKLQKIIRREPLILVIEDDEDNMLYHTTILSLSNYQFIKASDGRSGIDIAMDKLPDLILLDIVMPKVDGIEVIETLRLNPLTNHIHIIAVTGLASNQQIKMVMDVGCDDYLLKPFAIEQLEDKLTLLLNKSQALT